MKTKRHPMAVLTLAAVLASGVLAPAAPAFAARYSSGGFNDEYVFAATRGVNDMNGHPALKMPLFPIAFVLDVAALPFAVIAGFVG